MGTTIKSYLVQLLEKKGYDAGQVLEVDGPSEQNLIPLECVLEAIIAAPLSEQRAIRRNLVKIDSLNGDCLDYFRHLTQVMIASDTWERSNVFP